MKNSNNHIFKFARFMLCTSGCTGIIITIRIDLRMPKKLIQKLFRRLYERNHVIQDMLVPLETTEESVDVFEKEINVKS